MPKRRELPHFSSMVSELEFDSFSVEYYPQMWYSISKTISKAEYLDINGILGSLEQALKEDLEKSAQSIYDRYKKD